MNVYAVQFDIAWEEPEANFARLHRLLGEVRLAPGGLVVFPEMYATGFSMAADLCAGAAEASLSWLQQLARQRQVWVIGGIVRREPGTGLRNQAVCLDPEGKLRSTYSKRRPFSPVCEEQYYPPGREGVVMRVGELRVAPLLCYDLRFPELFRELLPGAQLFAVLANFPAARQDHWRTLLRARAIENQACVVGVNRVGTDPNATYAGGSLILGPRGEVLAEGGDQPQVLSATLDLPDLTAWRNEFPALRDRYRYEREANGPAAGYTAL